MQYIKIHALDNVAVALADLAEGNEVTVDGQAVILRQAVSRGHKFALCDIAKGENVIKYGLPIGHTLVDVAAGEHIHAHNTRTNLIFRRKLHNRRIAMCRFIDARTVTLGCATNCGSYRR